jgi:hypothetical protein
MPARPCPCRTSIETTRHSRSRALWAELVLEMGTPGGQLLEDAVALVEKLEGALIDVEAFVIE